MTPLTSLLTFFCFLPVISFLAALLILEELKVKKFCRHYFGLPAVFCISLLGASATYGQLQTLEAEEYTHFAEACAASGGSAYWRGAAADERVCLEGANQINTGKDQEND